MRRNNKFSDLTDGCRVGWKTTVFPVEVGSRSCGGLELGGQVASRALAWGGGESAQPSLCHWEMESGQTWSSDAEPAQPLKGVQDPPCAPKALEEELCPFVTSSASLTMDW